MATTIIYKYGEFLLNSSKYVSSSSKLWGARAFKCGLYQDDAEEYKRYDFWTIVVMLWTLGVYVTT
jgi:hypothetical protein